MLKLHIETARGEMYKGEQIKTEPPLIPVPGHRQRLYVFG